MYAAVDYAGPLESGDDAFPAEELCRRVDELIYNASPGRCELRSTGPFGE